MEDLTCDATYHWLPPLRSTVGELMEDAEDAFSESVACDVDLEAEGAIARDAIARFKAVHRISY